MGLTRDQMDTVVDRHFRFESEDDVEGVLSTLADDVEHDIVGWPAGPSRGREGARPVYEQMFDDLADGRVTTRKRLYGDGFIVDESLWEGTAVGRPFGLEGRGRALKFRVLHVLEFRETGEIQRENTWFDMAAIVAQLAGD